MHLALFTLPLAYTHTHTHTHTRIRAGWRPKDECGANNSRLSTRAKKSPLSRRAEIFTARAAAGRRANDNVIEVRSRLLANWAECDCCSARRRVLSDSLVERLSESDRGERERERDAVSVREYIYI